MIPMMLMLCYCQTHVSGVEEALTMTTAEKVFVEPRADSWLLTCGCFLASAAADSVARSWCVLVNCLNSNNELSAFLSLSISSFCRLSFELAVIPPPVHVPCHPPCFSSACTITKRNRWVGGGGGGGRGITRFLITPWCCWCSSNVLFTSFLFFFPHKLRWKIKSHYWFFVVGFSLKAKSVLHLQIVGVHWKFHLHDPDYADQM